MSRKLQSLIGLLRTDREREDKPPLASISLRKRVLATVRRDAAPRAVRRDAAARLELKASEQLGEQPD
jgi:hypothetical protein